jgi:hypothetical protein
MGAVAHVETKNKAELNYSNQKPDIDGDRDFHRFYLSAHAVQWIRVNG